MTEPPPTPTRHRILVVDDEPETASLIRTWYAGKPYDIAEARDGAEGERLALEFQPELILLDVSMPVQDGLETTRRLKADPRTSAIPVILLTARRDTPDKVIGFDAGADDYVTKPFDCEEVDARIQAMLRKRQLYLRLEDLARIDEKTGLANFRQFQDRLRDEWLRAERYGTPVSLIMLDLDDFKRLNDRYGHLAGDQVLKEFALLVAGGARATDIPARYGGEEFAVLLPHTDAAMAYRVAERIRSAVAEFVFLEGETPLRLTVSAGIATSPASPPVRSADELIRAADAALYRAKHAGKNVAVAASDGV